MPLYDPAIPLLDVSEEDKNNTVKEASTLFTRAKNWKQPKCPSIYELIKEIQYTYTMKYYLGMKICSTVI